MNLDEYICNIFDNNSSSFVFNMVKEPVPVLLHWKTILLHMYDVNDQPPNSIGYSMGHLQCHSIKAEGPIIAAITLCSSILNTVPQAL